MARYVIVGNGVAGTTAAEKIRKLDGDGEITMVTDEDTPFYYRVRLNEYLSGDIDKQQLVAKKEEWYRDLKIDLNLGCRIVDANPSEKRVSSMEGRRFPYDRLLIATGSHSFVPPIKGSDKKGVFTLRTVQDVQSISRWLEGPSDVVLIGGGLLGLEAGNAVRKLGKKVRVVEFFPRLLPRQLDVEGANRLQKMMENMGFVFNLGAKTEEITGKDQVDGVSLESGEHFRAEAVVISAGVRPNIKLAEPLALEKDKGIKVNERLETSQVDVFAAGDVAQFKEIPYGIWTAAMEQGRIAGTNMAGGDASYYGTTMANTLKVVGIDLASAGEIDVENQFESRKVADEEVYKKVVLEDGRIVGCIMLGDTKKFNEITKMMSDGTDVSGMVDRLLSG